MVLSILMCHTAKRIASPGAMLHGEFGEFQLAKRPKWLPTVLTNAEVQRVVRISTARMD